MEMKKDSKQNAKLNNKNKLNEPIISGKNFEQGKKYLRTSDFSKAKDAFEKAS